MTNLKVKETSKSGIIANLNGVYGQLSKGDFIPYTEDQLSSKTAYKNDYGWKTFNSIEDFIAHQNEMKQIRKEERILQEERIAQIKESDRNTIEKLISSGPIPSTVENVRLLLNWLNNQNWGSWTLPSMTIGYSAHQFDCDGKIATTIKLDQPISSEEYSIENETMFCVGAPRGHLSKYQKL